MRTRSRLIFVCLTALMFPIGFSACDQGGDLDNPYSDYFVKFYGSTLANQTGVDMVVNAEDGTVVIVGKSESSGVKNIYFLKVDGMGEVITETYIGGPTDEVKDIEPLGDDEYLILSNFVKGPDNIDVKLTRINGAGVVLDTVTTYSGKLNDVSTTLTVLSDGRIVVAGYTDDTVDNELEEADFADFKTWCFNSDLTPDDNWIYGLTGNGTNDVITKIVEQNGSLCAIGYSNAPLATNPQKNLVFIYFNLLYTGGSGNVIMPNVPPISTTMDTEVMSATKTSSNNPGYFATGVTRVNASSGELFICKLRSNLTFIDNQDVELYSKITPAGSANPNLTGISAAPSLLAPQGYYVVGNDVRSSGNSDIWLCKMDLGGQVVWSQRFGSDTGDDTAGAVAELPDGRILVLGTAEHGDNQRKVTLIKLNSKGELLK